jgi:hypothetical protein
VALALGAKLALRNRRAGGMGDWELVAAPGRDALGGLRWGGLQPAADFSPPATGLHRSREAG